MFRSFFIAALGFVAALYYLRYEKTRDIEGFAIQLTTLLDDKMTKDGFTLKSRTKRMNQAVYLVHRALEQRIELDKLFDAATERADLSDAYRASLEESLFRNLRLAQQFGLFTSPNLMRMEEGKMPLITRGGFEGEEAVLDEVVPDYLAPEASTEFANLFYRPSPMARYEEVLTFDRIETATRLHHAKVLSTLSYRRVLLAYDAS